MILARIIQIGLAAIITERLLDGLHKFYWTAKFKKYLVGDGDGRGILKDGPLREFIRCKFCQSFWVGWAAAAITLSMIGVAPPRGGWAFVFDIFWVGLCAGSLANKLHDVGVAIKVVKLLLYK
ncbi:MAG: hypothetical protein JXA50_01845 [Deltaproteobacteria bacterium]|nr:hypothetical protein [Deltaproteobacteria bacterium]